jgi:hypothetical protein
MFRIVLMSLVATLAAGAANAQEKKDPIPAPRPVPAPMPMPMPPVAVGPAVAIPGSPSAGTLWNPYTPQKYPVPGQIVVVPGNAYAYLPARAVYGPAASPNDYPYYAFRPGAPYPGYTMINPYPRTVSSYSYGPTVFPYYPGR